MDLLLACARSRWHAGEAERVRELLQDAVDPEEFSRLCLRHRLLPLVYWQLNELAGTDPEAAELLARLRGPFVENATSALRLTGELAEILRLWESHGIPAVPYKGPALAAQLYGNIALRPAGDLDLVVSRRDVAAARALLLSRGYRPRTELSRSSEAFMLRSRYSEEFRSAEFRVELHWAFTNGDVAFPLELDDLLPRLGRIPLGGASVAVFSDPDLLLILAVHGAKHRWDRLEWICGMAAAIDRARALDWNGLLRRATALGVRRMLLLGLLLAHDLFRAPVPPGVLRRAIRDRSVPRLAAQVPQLLERVATDPEAGSLPVDLFRFALRERPRDRLRFLWYRLTTPSRGESWAVVSLGRWSIPLHAFRRPFQLLGSVFPAARAYWRSSSNA